MRTWGCWEGWPGHDVRYRGIEAGVEELREQPPKGRD
jgi:hypothetical protein